jgi:hypothetical protein
MWNSSSLHPTTLTSEVADLWLHLDPPSSLVGWLADNNSMTPELMVEWEGLLRKLFPAFRIPLGEARTDGRGKCESGPVEQLHAFWLPILGSLAVARGESYVG